jgi:hypothetical protein
MTTNVFDGAAGMMATDSRWSIKYGSYLIFLDDAGFEKIEFLGDFALMFAGLGPRVQEWKTWIRSNPDTETMPGQPAHQGMAVCMSHIPTKSVAFARGQKITKDGASFAGTGSFAAYTCWAANKDAKRAVTTAMSADIFTGGEVKFSNFADGSHNIYAGGADVQYADLLKQILTRGLVMPTTKPIAPFPLKDAVASNDDLQKAVEKIANGELHASAPDDSMLSDWTAAEKDEFNKALKKAFASKKR